MRRLYSPEQIKNMVKFYSHKVNFSTDAGPLQIVVNSTRPNAYTAADVKNGGVFLGALVIDTKLMHTAGMYTLSETSTMTITLLDGSGTYIVHKNSFSTITDTVAEV